MFPRSKLAAVCIALDTCCSATGLYYTCECVCATSNQRPLDVTARLGAPTLCSAPVEWVSWLVSSWVSAPRALEVSQEQTGDEGCSGTNTFHIQTSESHPLAKRYTITCDKQVHFVRRYLSTQLGDKPQKSRAEQRRNSGGLQYLALETLNVTARNYRSREKARARESVVNKKLCFFSTNTAPVNPSHHRRPGRYTAK